MFLFCLLLCTVVLTCSACSTQAGTSDLPEGTDESVADSVTADSVEETEELGTIERFFLQTVGEELCVFFCAMIPIIECRGAVPLGILLGLPWWQTLLFSVVGNLIPVPFILLFIRAFLRFAVNCNVKLLNRFANWLNAKVEKHKGTIEKYSYWGIMIFVGIPLPGTGAWTGTLIASVLGLEPKKSFFAALGGITMATVIMLAGSLLVKYGISFFG